MMAQNGGLYGGRSLPLTADIELINLVDVAFVLLVIFMITAPIFQGGVEVQLPKGEVAPLRPSDAVVVSIDKDGGIFIDDTQVTYEEFSGAIKDLWIRKGSPPVLVKADKRTSYGIVLRVIAVLKAREIVSVGLVAEPEPRPRR